VCVWWREGPWFVGGGGSRPAGPCLSCVARLTSAPACAAPPGTCPDRRGTPLRVC
jgi:hypothetical protein